MIVYPAIDLMGGRCVRLAQGRFEDATVYDGDPADALVRFAAAGAAWAHVVDLDGARARQPVQHDLIASLAASAPLRLQVAGGVRNAGHVARLLDAGAGRVVVGSLAVEDPAAVRALLKTYGADRITLALDVRIIDGRAMVATAGWAETSARSLDDVIGAYPEARHLLVTDIGRDGMLSGPNLELARTVAAAHPGIAFQASGGVADAADLAALAATGAAGAIVGKALWEGRFTLEEALAYAGA